MTRADEENRGSQVAVAACILGVLTLAVCGALIGWRYLPGVLGEWIGTMVGVLTTPFFLEASFVIIGLMVVVVVNHWRQKRAGEELVYLEQVDGPEVPGGMPERAKWAVFREKPLAGEIPSLLVQAEGALAIGDFDGAAELIGGMAEADLKLPETLVLRLELAKATGKAGLADHLANELRAARNGKL